ncbi:L-rhamnonate dehydratase-like [Gigantopelta aegis]|uniref:L-rhamnonate dehydratase-like n=1 Tax=Gigantopelta aegis TaxID=1735272 RepID=UPI001B88E3C7|nr:L-rhamnonate dehydratase-like [Gigantopelta aegis]
MSTKNQVRSFPRVKAVRAYTTVAAVSGNQGSDCHDVRKDHWIDGGLAPIANPMSGYAEYTSSRTSWGINALGSVVVEVEADDGSCGVGVTIGGEPAAYIVERHLSRFVEGQDPRDVELIWDQMFRSTLNYGRKGLPIQAISAVDLALWDLLGKLRNEPVYALLGGKTKDRLPVYSTTARPDVAKEFGFVGAKIPCPYGPDAGNEGFEKNITFFREWREKVGPDFPLMLDCYMALSVPYTVKLARELEPLGLKWIEEYLPPDNYNGYKEVRKSLRGSKVLLTTGEHEYTRYGFQQLLSSNCVDIIQPDITWVGGITEARRVVAMASAYDVMVIPHGSSVYSYHLQYAYRNCPLAEFINLSPKADEIKPYFGGLFPDEPLPTNGFIDLPEKPGFGITLCKDKLSRPYSRSEEESKKQAKANIERKVTGIATFPL